MNSHEKSPQQTKELKRMIAAGSILGGLAVMSIAGLLIGGVVAWNSDKIANWVQGKKT